MKISHIAIFSKNIEVLRHFYEKYFRGKSSGKYINYKTKFESYFINFDSDVRLEIMYKPEVVESKNESYNLHTGFAHIAFSVGSKEKVNELTTQLKNDNVVIVSEPRLTGDGYYESVILDPEGNIIEITI